MSDNSRNRVFTKAGVAEGTNANTYKTTNTVIYSIKGQMYSDAAEDNVAFTAGHTALGAYQKCIIGVCLDANGALSTIQGPIVDVNSATNATADSVVPWPVPSDDKVLIGGIVIETANTTFTFGSTDLSAASVTDSYIDCDGLPPQTVTTYAKDSSA